MWKKIFDGKLCWFGLDACSIKNMIMVIGREYLGSVELINVSSEEQPPVIISCNTQIPEAHRRGYRITNILWIIRDHLF